MMMNAHMRGLIISTGLVCYAGIIILILLFTYLPVCICFANCLLKAQIVVVVSIFVFQGGCFFPVAAACWFIVAIILGSPSMFCYFFVN